jgi:hypothetical protein
MVNFPDHWVIIEQLLDNKQSKKVLAGWYGGYYTSNSWKLSSGIVKVTKENQNVFHFDNVSGSHYVCKKDEYGMTDLMSGALTFYEKEIVKAGGKIRILPLDDVEALV